MGILNCTPDSFYDGGRYNNSLQSSIDRASQIVKEGGAIIDVGGESTRPGSTPVSLDEELSRVIPVIEAISSRFGIVISIDTTKSTVAREACGVGATIINDISAGRFDSKMASVVSELQAKVILMHSRKTPKNMQDNPKYINATKEVIDELLTQVELFGKAGVSKSDIILDPGIGFAKDDIANFNLLKNIDKIIEETGFEVLVGTSQKSFIGRLLGENSERLSASLATIGHTYRQGANYFRVHDVKESVNYLKMMDSLIG